MDFSKNMTIASTVPGDSPVAARIDLYLAERFTYFSRTRWQHEIKLGKLLCNGAAVTSPHKPVAPGDIISYEGTGMEEPPVSRAYSIAYDDGLLTAVNKPSNLPVHPSGCFFKNTLLSFLEADMNKKFYPINRIDRETSGLVLFSQRGQSVPLLQKALAEGEKTYFVFVHGRPAEDQFTVSAPIGAARNSLIRKKREAYGDAAESALTRFTKIRECGELTLLKAVIETGRTHQIRAHCLYAGLPVAGDKMYGLDERCYLEFIENGMSEKITSVLGFHRSALHCGSIELTHPVSGKKLLLSAPLPNDLAGLLG